MALTARPCSLALDLLSESAGLLELKWVLYFTSGLETDFSSQSLDEVIPADQQPEGLSMDNMSATLHYVYINCCTERVTGPYQCSFSHVPSLATTELPAASTGTK